MTCRHSYGVTPDISMKKLYRIDRWPSIFAKLKGGKPDTGISHFVTFIDFFLVRKEDGTLRTMNADKLLKTIPVLQSQLDGLLEFDCTPNDLTNGIINMCFMLLFRDLIRLFACYNDGIINLLGKC